MKIGDVVRAIDEDAIIDQDWWDAFGEQDLSGMLTPIIKSTIGTVDKDKDGGDYFAVVFNVMLPLKLRLYFNEQELEKME